MSILFTSLLLFIAPRLLPVVATVTSVGSSQKDVLLTVEIQKSGETSKYALLLSPGWIGVFDDAVSDLTGWNVQGRSLTRISRAEYKLSSELPNAVAVPFLSKDMSLEDATLKIEWKQNSEKQTTDIDIKDCESRENLPLTNLFRLHDFCTTFNESPDFEGSFAVFVEIGNKQFLVGALGYSGTKADEDRRPRYYNMVYNPTHSQKLVVKIEKPGQDDTYIGVLVSSAWILTDDGGTDLTGWLIEKQEYALTEKRSGPDNRYVLYKTSRPVHAGPMPIIQSNNLLPTATFRVVWKTTTGLILRKMAHFVACGTRNKVAFSSLIDSTWFCAKNGKNRGRRFINQKFVEDTGNKGAFPIYTEVEGKKFLVGLVTKTKTHNGARYNQCVNLVLMRQDIQDDILSPHHIPHLTEGTPIVKKKSKAKRQLETQETEPIAKKAGTCDLQVQLDCVKKCFGEAYQQPSRGN